MRDTSACDFAETEKDSPQATSSKKVRPYIFTREGTNHASRGVEGNRGGRAPKVGLCRAARMTEMSPPTFNCCGAGRASWHSQLHTCCPHTSPREHVHQTALERQGTRPRACTRWLSTARRRPHTTHTLSLPRCSHFQERRLHAVDKRASWAQDSKRRGAAQDRDAGRDVANGQCQPAERERERQPLQPRGISRGALRLLPPADADTCRRHRSLVSRGFRVCVCV